MRFIQLGFCIAIALIVPFRSASAESILIADCSVNQLLCLEVPHAFGSLGLSAPGVAYNSPSETSGDSQSISGSINPAQGIVLTGSSSGNFSVGYSGFHTDLSSTGDIFCGINTCPFGTDAGAVSQGLILDYFGTGNNVPVGTELALTFTVDANGNSIQIPGEGSTSSFLNISFLASTKSSGNIEKQCSNPSVANIVGDFTYSCTLLLPVLSDDVILTNIVVTGQSQSNIPVTNTLDASDTAKLASAVLVDSNGNPLPNLQLYDTSGYDYDAAVSTAPSATPEPSSFLLLATGSLGVVGTLRRRLL